MPNQLPGRFNFCSTLGQSEADRLVVENGLPKALTLPGVGQRTFKRATRHAHALGGDANAPAFQSAQRNFVTFALLPNQVVCWDAAMVKIYLCGIAAVLAQFVFQTRHHIARRAGGDDERTHAFFASALVRHGNHDRHLSVFAAGDELLDAIDDVPITVLDGCCFQCGGIAAHMRFCQTKRAQHLPLRQRCQPLLLLRGIAITHQNRVDGAIGHADRRAGAAVACGNFFQHHRQGEVVQMGATKFFRHADAVSTQLRQPFMNLFREVVLLVPLGGMWPELLLREGTNGVADHFLVLRQQHQISSKVSAVASPPPMHSVARPRLRPRACKA